MAEIFDFGKERARLRSSESTKSSEERIPELDMARFEMMRRIVEEASARMPEESKSRLVARAQEFASSLSYSQMVGYVNGSNEREWTTNPALYGVMAQELLAANTDTSTEGS